MQRSARRKGACLCLAPPQIPHPLVPFTSHWPGPRALTSSTCAELCSPAARPAAPSAALSAATQHPEAQLLPLRPWALKPLFPKCPLDLPSPGQGAPPGPAHLSAIAAAWPPAARTALPSQGLRRRCPLLNAPGAPTALCSSERISLFLLKAWFALPTPALSAPGKATALQSLLRRRPPEPGPPSSCAGSSPGCRGSGFLRTPVPALRAVRPPGEGASPGELSRPPRGEEGSFGSSPAPPARACWPPAAQLGRGVDLGSPSLPLTRDSESWGSPVPRFPTPTNPRAVRCSDVHGSIHTIGHGPTGHARRALRPPQ